MLVGESSQTTQSQSGGSDVGKEISATTSESSSSAHQAKQQSTGGASSKSQQKPSGSDQEATTASAKKRPSDVPRPLAVKVCSLHESHIQLFSSVSIILTFTEI